VEVAMPRSAAPGGGRAVGRGRIRGEWRPWHHRAGREHESRTVNGERRRGHRRRGGKHPWAFGTRRCSIGRCLREMEAGARGTAHGRVRDHHLTDVHRDYESDFSRGDKFRDVFNFER
jgi:hypothetical protein